MLEDGTDLDKLAKAVAMAETSNCTKGSGKSKKNCHGLMNWKTGTRRLNVYDTTDQSFNDFKDLWKRVYKIYPTPALAKLYTGDDSPHTWLATVNQTYNSL